MGASIFFEIIKLSDISFFKKNFSSRTGESGVGKTTILNNLLDQLCKEGGTSTKAGTVLGSILNYSDKSHSILESINSLTRGGEIEQEGKSLELILGASRPKPPTGVIRSTIQFSAQTTSSRLQAQITQRLIKKSRDTLGAPRGRKVCRLLL